jgi:hypothetical protein
MSTIHLHQTTTLTPEQYIAGLTDFGPGRSKLFGRSADEYLKVHDRGATQADVTEGSGGIWERLRHRGDSQCAAFRRCKSGRVLSPQPNGPILGLDAERRSYYSRAEFEDPDGNTWVLQEITSRLPGRVEPGPTSFASASDLASALPRAAVAHGKHEARTGQRDENWPDWYAEYMVREQTGEELSK